VKLGELRVYQDKWKIDMDSKSLSLTFTSEMVEKASAHPVFLI